MAKKSNIRKKIVDHLHDDIKTFHKEAAEDQALIKKVNKANGKKKPRVKKAVKKVQIKRK